MSERPIKVSIIVPCYNAEQYLPQCLDSLVNQTLDDIEVICVNDASPDNGIDILRRYEREYPGIVKVIDLPVNRHQGGARNVGMSRAQGEYITFVDSDDWVALDMLECLYAVTAATGADVVQCAYCVAESRACAPIDSGSGMVSGGEQTDTDRKNRLLEGGAMPVGALYSRSLIEKHSLMFVPDLFFEDMAWTPVVTMCAKSFYYADRMLYYCYANPDSTTRRRNSEHHYDLLKAYPNILFEAEKRGVYERFKNEIDFRFIKIYYMQPLYIFVEMLSEVKLDKLYEMRLLMNELLPDYRDNPYMPRSYAFGRVIASFLDTDPQLAFEYMKTITDPYRED